MSLTMFILNVKINYGIKDFPTAYMWVKHRYNSVHVILICSSQTVAACDQCHHGSGPVAGDPGKVCAGGSSTKRGQGERRQTLEPTTFPSGPRHLRVDLQAHGVWTHSHIKQIKHSRWTHTPCCLFRSIQGLSCGVRRAKTLWHVLIEITV